MSVARWLFAAYVMRYFLWPWFPVEMRGDISKASGAALGLCMLFALYRQMPKAPDMLQVFLLAAWLDGQTVLLSVAHALWPWPIPPGTSYASSLIGFDTGAIDLVVVAVLAYKLSTLTVSQTPTGQENEL